VMTVEPAPDTQGSGTARSRPATIRNRSIGRGHIADSAPAI
jgi:hypothetical protein